MAGMDAVFYVAKIWREKRFRQDSAISKKCWPVPMLSHFAEDQLDKAVNQKRPKKNTYKFLCKCQFSFVGTTRFELVTPCL